MEFSWKYTPKKSRGDNRNDLQSNTARRLSRLRTIGPDRPTTELHSASSLPPRPRRAAKHIERTCGKCHTNTLMGRKGDPGELPPVSSLPAPYQRIHQASGLCGPVWLAKSSSSRWGGKPRPNSSRGFRNYRRVTHTFQFEGMNDDTTVNITAYVLQVNGAKAGTQELTRTTSAVVNSLVQ